MNLVSGARAPAPLVRLRLTRSAPRARVSAGNWALRAQFPAPKQITSVKGMNQKGMNLEIVNSKNYKDIWNYSDKTNHLVVMNLITGYKDICKYSKYVNYSEI